jgi:hypothetical protein
VSHLTVNGSQKNGDPEFISACAVWASTGRSPIELGQIIRVIAERAFIARVWPSPKQIAAWQTRGRGSLELGAHVRRQTGRLITFECAKTIWRLVTSHTEPRRRATIADFIQGIPDSWKCESCGATEGPFEIDHVIPLRKGGLDRITNLQILCVGCNRRKGAQSDSRKVYLQFED